MGFGLWEGLRFFKEDPLLMLAIFGSFSCIALLFLLVLALRQGALRARVEDQRSAKVQASAAELAELKGRLTQLTEIMAMRQEELTQTVNNQFDRVGEQLGSKLETTGRQTSDNLARLNERLATIDAAQKTIAELSGRMVSLQQVLGDKQARGAFGQIRMEALIQDGLPKGAFSFQATLSNGRRPDCLIYLPYSAAAIVVDAKFPLENIEALRSAGSAEARRQAGAGVRRDVSRHLADISEKYFIPGETQDTAMMFVPSESVYADLHENFPDLIQAAYRSRIVIVSPNMLMLAIQTMMAILKDARMREQADVIQREAGLMIEDVSRLRERITEFQRRFNQLGPDVEKIVISADKIGGRAAKIEGAELGERKDVKAELMAAE
jgi:DNA recombination protein RmuC